MTTRHVRSALIASALTFSVVALAPVTGRAQDTAIPEEGGPITMTGCFTTGQIKDHERFVLAKPIVGTVASVPEATCSASASDQIVKLQDMKQVNLGQATLGRWIQIQGRLEGNHRADGIREVHVKSFSLVPVVVPAPRVSETVIVPQPYVPPAPAPQVAEAAPAPVPEPAPVATTGERKALPKTATSLPLVGLIGFLSLAVGFALHLFTRRRVNLV
jgi:hypothetical protein